MGGVDGAKGQWLLVTIVDAIVQFHLAPRFGDVVGLADDVQLACVGVDMPIGLPVDGPRAADVEARRRLGHRASTLFPTPVAAVVDAADYADACARSRAVSGKAISKQTWNLMPMIRDVRAAVRGSAAGRFVEVHPESTFCALGGGPLPSKKTAAGVGHRLRLLRPAVPGLDEALATAPPGVAIDDALDALAAAIGAHRLVAGEAEVLGSGLDQEGFPLQLVI